MSVQDPHQHLKETLAHSLLMKREDEIPPMPDSLLEAIKPIVQPSEESRPRTLLQRLGAFMLKPAPALTGMALLIGGIYLGTTPPSPKPSEYVRAAQQDSALKTVQIGFYQLEAGQLEALEAALDPSLMTRLTTDQEMQQFLSDSSGTRILLNGRKGLLIHFPANSSTPSDEIPLPEETSAILRLLQNLQVAE
ncbi:MAG: hypothetical protein PVJ98_00615 [Akkermansiaceae bacterium]|jgi:hypothetical protein